ncbi:AI-2E family transporter [Sediminibacterium sp.]|uniref:AI-2E family transporter n=1 Tax=Sediminibacterium sp. TaxID=1917865 RepID=UPI0027306993|nr:AI-2E family transporter [Sediminibacterium sp.]MDP2420290.1 AI-2E family transporter [Sediminibacterium sp.]
MQQDHKINRYIFLAVILLFAGFLFFTLKEFFTAFLAALLFYILSKPSVEFLIKKKNWSKTMAAILVIVVSFFIILLPFSLLVGMLYNKAIMIAGDTDSFLAPLKELDKKLQADYHFQLLSEKNLSGIQNYFTNFISSLLSQGLNLLSSMGMMYFILYFMIVNINRMEAAVVFYLPFKREKIMLFANELHAQTVSNAVGVPLIAVVQGTLAWGYYWWVDLSQPGFWAVLTGLSSIIPIVGAGIIWLPISFYLMANVGIAEGVGLIAWGAIVLGTMDNVVRFVLAKKMADVHPLVTLLGVIMGLEYFGITGLIFGPVLISYFLILLKIYYQEFQHTHPVIKKRVIKSQFKIPFLNRD